MSDPRREPIVVEQSNVSVNVLWGFLCVAFGVALWRGHAGAETGAGRWVLDVVLGAGVFLSAAAWISFRRHPARLEISEEVVRFSHRGQPNSIELRRPGPLYVHRQFNPRGGAQSYLKAVGSDDAVPLVLFDWRAVERACLATGWPIAERRWRRKPPG